MKIALCGGHLTPALAVMDFVLAEHPEDTVMFIGRQFSQVATQQLSHEATEVEKRQVAFLAFSAPRFNHTPSLQHLLLIPQILIATVSGFFIFLKHRPDVFLSFGGYLALPLTVACTILGIPVVTHEQTKAVGFANQVIARLAQKVALANESSLKYVPKEKAIVTGNPLRPGLFKNQPRPTWLSSPITKPILYITGGNQGSEILNTTTQKALRSLVSYWFVIHQCGNQTQRRNYKQELEQARKQLPGTQHAHYVIKEWITEEEMGWIYQHAQVVISRAGANTVSELMAHHLPSILIPLPFAHHDEQLLNAQQMKEIGGAEIILQKDLTAANLLKTLQLLKKYHKTMAEHLTQVKTDVKASQKLYDILVSVTK